MKDDRVRNHGDSLLTPNDFRVYWDSDVGLAIWRFFDVRQSIENQSDRVRVLGDGNCFGCRWRSYLYPSLEIWDTHPKSILAAMLNGRPCLPDGQHISISNPVQQMDRTSEHSVCHDGNHVPDQYDFVHAQKCSFTIHNDRPPGINHLRRQRNVDQPDEFISEVTRFSPGTQGKNPDQTESGTSTI